ncbi:hypothetical protein CCO03_08585 [Comamonas serinivorans]|uniref:Uncharacterized protein n=1 Tax=Comamonas serinivorans TaxID=1082851 RepID=A0A1Y0EM58_9BURK|nr:hypothetical protein [Comamonas serinivorans]ARU04723.1 hypothetical protein CCO03_08585 [Comamonas serinivorans]
MPQDRYALFYGYSNQKRGGWHDWVSSSPSLYALQHSILTEGDWAHIVDLEQNTVIQAKTCHPGQSLNEVPWFPDMKADYMGPLVMLAMPLDEDEEYKLNDLGGESWVRAVLKMAEVPDPLPVETGRLGVLRALAARTYPTVLLEYQEGSEVVVPLIREGLVDGVFDMHDADGETYAEVTIYSLTDKGRDVANGN